MEQGVSQRKLGILLFGAMLSPLIRAVPGSGIAWGGRAAWLSPLWVILPYCAQMWLLAAALRRTGGDLGEVLKRGYGMILGRVICLAMAVWLTVELWFAVRLYGERFLGSAYRDASLFFFMLTLLAVTVWQNRMSLGAVLRLGQVCFYPLVGTVAVLLILSANSVRWENVLPVSWREVTGAAVGGAGVLSVLALVPVGGFLWQDVRRDQSAGSALRWGIGFLIMAAVAGLVIQGVFGIRLTRRLQVPLFILSKELRMDYALERMDAVVIALWVLSDLLLVLLLERCICRAFAAGLELRRERELGVPVLVSALFGSVLCGSREEVVLRLGETWLIWLRIGLMYGVVPLGCVLCILKKKMEKLEKGG